MVELPEQAHLRACWARHPSMRFPPSGGEPRLSELKPELAEYDGYIAGIAHTVSSGLRSPYAARTNPGLRSRLVRLRSELEGGSRTTAGLWLAYVSSVERLARGVARCQGAAHPTAD